MLTSLLWKRSTSADRGADRYIAKLVQALYWAHAIGRHVKEEHVPEKFGRILCETVHDCDRTSWEGEECRGER